MDPPWKKKHKKEFAFQGHKKGGRNEASQLLVELESVTSSDYKLHNSFSAAIHGYERYGFTLYSIGITNGQQAWTIYRRYSDFVSLNGKLRMLFSHIRLKLPPKRILRNNFDATFLAKRQAGLEKFMKQLLSIPALLDNDAVRNFFRLESPPEPNVSLIIETSFDGVHEKYSELEENLTATQLELDSVVSAAASALGQLGELSINDGGRIIELKVPGVVRERTESLRKSLDKEKQLREEQINMYKHTADELTLHLRTVRAAVSQMVCQYEGELADMSHVKTAEQKYLFSLLLGIQLSKGLSGRPTECVNLKQLQITFAQIKQENIAIDDWPTWIHQSVPDLIGGK